MTFDEMDKAVSEAVRTIRIANQHIATMAGICAGRLRSGNTSSYILKQLKDELREYNAHTKEWK